MVGPFLVPVLLEKPFERSRSSGHHQHWESLLGLPLDRMAQRQRPSVLAQGQIKWGQANLCPCQDGPRRGRCWVACSPLHRLA